jgi:ferredoxin-type protein NapH
MSKSNRESWAINKKTLMLPIIMLLVFSTIAIVLSILLSNGFYLFNFLYIGGSVSIGMFLFLAMPKKLKPLGRKISQLLVGLYMLVFLGFIQGENMQIEGFWVYIASGVFAGATIHYLVAKVAGPLFFSRGWCGWACWTAMVLDFLPYKESKKAPSKKLGAIRYVHLFLTIAFVVVVYFVLSAKNQTLKPGWELYWLIIGNALYYLVGIVLAIILKDNRAFCKIICPIPVLMKPAARLSLLKIQVDPIKCIDCKKCEQKCPMDIKLLEYKNIGKRVCSTECILCNTCYSVCPTGAIKMNVGIGDKIR